MSLSTAWKQPEVRVSASLVGGAGLLFLVESLALVGQQGAGILYLPLVVFVLNSASTAVILAGQRALRAVVLVIVVLGVLVHMVILLGGGPVWARILSGVFAAAQVYALVVLNTKPVRVHFGLDVDDPR